MPLTLTHLDQSSPTRFVLRNGQRVTVGRGNDADFVCAGEQAIADMHFAVQANGDGGQLFNLASDGEQLWLNDQPVYHQTELKHGDRVQAGECLFAVTLTGAPPAPAKVVTEPVRVRRMLLESQSVRLQVGEGESWVKEVLNAVAAGKQVHIVANFRAAWLPLPVELKADDDLFAAAPPEVRAGNSLHVWTPVDPLAAIQKLMPLWRKDAMMVLISDQSREELLASHKLHWAWFRAPSALAVQLSRGSADLAKALLKNIHAVIMPDAGKSLSLYLPLAEAPAMHTNLVAIRVPVANS